MSTPHFPTLSTSVTAVRMKPTSPSPNGFGHSRSMNWHYLAISIANKNGEKCNHFDKKNHSFPIEHVLITMSPLNEGIGDKIKFKVSCASCEKLFPLTSAKLTKKFIKFYGL